MTKPVDLKQIRARHERCLSAGNQMDGLIVYDDRAALLSLVDTQAAEIKRLRDAIDAAPHDSMCDIDDGGTCNCWKAALKQESSDDDS